MNEVTELRNNHQKETKVVGGEERRGQMREQERRKKRVKETHIVSPSLDLLVQLVLVLIPERRVTHQQDVEDHP